MRLMILVFSLLLAACAINPRQQQANFDAQVDAQRDAKQIKYVEAQKLKWENAKKLWPGNPSVGEYFSYTVMLGEEVDAGTLSPGEYEYLAHKQLSEIRERDNINSLRRAETTATMMNAMPKTEPIQYHPIVQPVPLKQPSQTNCYTDSLGYTRCTTY